MDQREQINPFQRRRTTAATTEIVQRCARKVFHENGYPFSEAAIIEITMPIVNTIEDVLDYPERYAANPPQVVAQYLDAWVLYCKLLNEIDKEIPVVATFGVWYMGQSRAAAC
jgi:hypothetical protein